MTKIALLECPMCDFTVLPSDDYVLQLHFEQVHTTDSPFVIEDDPESLPPSLPPRPPTSSTDDHVKDTPSSDEEESTVECPEPNCGELILLSHFNDHLEYHTAETLSFDETTGKYHSHHSSAIMQELAPTHNLSTRPDGLKGKERHMRKTKKLPHRDRSDSNSSEKSTIGRSILSFSPFPSLDKTVKPPLKSARLGKPELGPYAWEARMPTWLHAQLEAGPKITAVNRIGRDGRLIKHEQVQNETPGIIPILAQLSALDRAVKEAYYCHPSTIHVGKTPKEGSFCGYRNIQMLLSYIQGARAQGYEAFPGRTPGILNIQERIENAWDKGINHVSRIQTGGIRNTRKYIGTPEAQAFFLESEINCAVEQFCDNKERGIKAHDLLLAAMERYFARAAVSDGSNVYKTLLPPVYLQQHGHSITIIGFERHRDGSCNLIVFDPSYSTSPAMHMLVGRKNIRTARTEVLAAYRRDARRLKNHAAFEILMLMATPPLFPAWDVLRQFPDCRFIYAFFRAHTLGYDVYPEEYFLRNFPWQQYGGLWSCDEARFARAEPLHALTISSLRRITSEGSSSNGSSPTSPSSLFANSLHHVTPTLPHLTDVGRRYPGFPTALSKRSVSPISMDGMGLIDSVLSGNNGGSVREALRAPSTSFLPAMNPSYNTPMRQALRAPSCNSVQSASPPTTGPQRCISPRAAMLRTMHSRPGPPGLEFHPTTRNISNACTPASPPPPLSSVFPKPSSPNVQQQPTPTIHIANGVQSEATSPIDPSGIILLYTSNRSAVSGLLGVTPLSEAQVAEYRFWRPCSRRVCAFGCGGANAGEAAAAKRLFRDVSEVEDKDECAAHGQTCASARFGCDGQSDHATVAEACEAEEAKSSTWAGRRLVTNWGQFLRGCEREGIAQY
ncbi:DUF1671-domain-containing protein [Clathrospora elynae]|uniref:DUF1671-domain-containing protein n=1 Tax=Clathrospora elynae TaxID=706981 RepID=A0A6A5SPS7_9PLEO|nr:DUF1671-domain-containing protein [Clathrospora elynae]